MATTSVYVLRVSPSCLLPLLEALQDQQVSLAQATFKLLLLPWVSECEILRTSFNSGVSESYSSLALLNASPTGLQSQMFWELIFLISGPSCWGAFCGTCTPHSLGRMSAIMIILHMWVTCLGIWVLTLLCF